MNLLKVFTKFWQPASKCSPNESVQMNKLSFLSKIPTSSAWNLMFCMQDGTLASYPNNSTNLKDEQYNTRVLPTQANLTKNPLYWMKASSFASPKASTVLSTVPLDRLNCGSDFSSNSIFLSGDGLEDTLRTTLHPMVGHNTQLKRRPPNSEEHELVTSSSETAFSCLFARSNVLRRSGPRAFLNARKRFGTFSPSEGPEKSEMKVPKLILIRNPLTWLSTKFDFRVLKSLWDPQFVEDEFRAGTVMAISTVTHILSDGKFDNLVGLLTKPARACLLKEVGRSWPGRKLKLIALSPNDIQISVPRKVYFLRIADKKFCDIDMAFMALKWISSNKRDGMLFAEIFARFHREYTQHCIPEWTIAYFKVTRFDIMKK